MPVNKIVGLLAIGAGFGLSLSCIVYSALSLWRIHKRRLADLDRHRPLDYYDPNWVICDCCGRLVRREELENRFQQRQKEMAVAIRMINELPPPNLKEVEATFRRMTEEKLEDLKERGVL